MGVPSNEVLFAKKRRYYPEKVKILLGNPLQIAGYKKVNTDLWSKSHQLKFDKQLPALEVNSSMNIKRNLFGPGGSNASKNVSILETDIFNEQTIPLKSVNQHVNNISFANIRKNYYRSKLSGLEDNPSFSLPHIPNQKCSRTDKINLSMWSRHSSIIDSHQQTKPLDRGKKSLNMLRVTSELGEYKKPRRNNNLLSLESHGAAGSISQKEDSIFCDEQHSSTQLLKDR